MVTACTLMAERFLSIGNGQDVVAVLFKATSRDFSRLSLILRPKNHLSRRHGAQSSRKDLAVLSFNRHRPHWP